MDNQPFVTKLTAQPSYALGEPVLITFTLDNTDAGNAYQLLVWGTPLEDPLTTDCFTLLREGTPTPYDGRVVKRGDPQAESYVVIGPGGQLSHTLDISQAYAVDQPGEYTLTLNTTVSDAFLVAGMAKQAPRKRQVHTPHKLPATSVTFTITAGGSPKLTAGQAARQAVKQAKGNAKSPNFTGGTAAQQAQTIIAHNNAQYFAAQAAAQLNAGPASTNALFQQWFGAFDQGRYDTVTKHYTDIANVLGTEQVTYNITGDGCESDWFAYTHKGDRTVWLCSAYLSAPQIGTDCKFGTLVHEWSHAVSSTDDNAYGETACLSLATTNTGKAINNADSHEYFTEHLAQSNTGKSITFITDRSVFGKDEIDAMLGAGSPAVIEKAFYIVAEGFWPEKLGITAATLGNAPTVKPVITVSPNVSGMTIRVASLEAEDVTLPTAPQRFTWVCDILFSSDSGFPNAPGQETAVTLSATLASLAGFAQIRLVHEPNPYELDGSTSWLSTDLRVFQIRAGESRFGTTMGNTAGGASTFIKQVITNLNAGNTAGQSFDGISTDQQTSALELSQQVNNTRIFNFAVAKVRYRGTLDINTVRVFFRLFPAATTTTAFDGATTYRRATQGGHTIATLGVNPSGDLLTIPCFAEPRVNTATTALDTQTDLANVRTIVHLANGQEGVAYFGCWLDINQTDVQFPAKPGVGNGPWVSDRKSIQELMRNAHQCLVAEIAFDASPIAAGDTPAISDKLAQRNLAIIQSANPGHEASRRILNTFDLRPVPAGKVKETFSELLIEWGTTPRASIATIYIPEIGADQIISLANARYASHNLTQVDERTIQVSVGGIAYVPLPPGLAFGLTGLLSIELPGTVKKGEVYTVVVRQLTDAGGRITIPQDGQAVVAAVAVPPRTVTRWRQVVGSYQITIPVRTKEVMLPHETRLLSVLRWIQKSVPAGDRWFPVFNRYVTLVGERVGALGGQPDQVEASPAGNGGKPSQEPGQDHGPAHGQQPPYEAQPREHTFDGKISGIIYDCYGDFRGFFLDECGTEHQFLAREKTIEELVSAAWHERTSLTIIATGKEHLQPLSIILRRSSVSVC